MFANQSDLDESTLRDSEKGRRVPTTGNLAAIRRALEEAGVEFIPENGGGPGVRLRKGIGLGGGPSFTGRW
ncbi:XRE family transcriptional regulator [Blastochloris sulfoviridis]|uniref:XRE family transcriptional regulator n=1 Tax=Blastochloris sulfoviridis TaxID=50712 RepID=A0A5M6I495_9HYPH|nr:XRE family transcriptional regulator [Blastochloris sulfoviridis]